MSMRDSSTSRKGGPYEPATTDRRRSESASRLSESEQRYSLLFDHSPFAISLIRLPDGVLVDVNQAFLDLFQATREELIGRTGSELGLVPPEERARVMAALDSQGIVRDLECSPRTLRGEERIVSLCLSRLTIDDKVHVFTTVQDLTARKRAERALSETEERFRLLLEDAHRVGFVGVYDWDIGADTVYWSPEVYRLMGVEPGAFQPSSQAWADGLADEDRELAERRFRETVAARREAYDIEVRIRQPGGGTRWVRISLVVRYDDRGAPTRVLGTLVDIEALKRTAEVREAERQRLLSLLAQIPALINFLRGPDMVIEFAHPLSIAAVGGRDIVGKPLLEALPEAREQPHYQRLRRVYETGEPDYKQEVHTWTEVDGRRVDRYWDSAHLPVRDASGKLEGVMTFEVEVTKNVLARRALEIANRVKDEFMHTISHELRTPLTAILGWATLLQRQAPEEQKLDRALEVIERNGRALERIVNDLLDVSCIISGKLQLTLQRTDVAAVVVAAVDVVRPAAEAKGVRLVMDLDPDLGETVADTDRLRQIVWNLLSNAVRFTPRGGRVAVSAARKDDGIQIRVEDTGVGIPSEHLAHVFERFQQVDGSVTRTYGGLGLGLSIVRHLAEAHGGGVEAHSEGPDRGATFIVKLPARGAEALRSSPPARDGLKSGSRGRSTKQRKSLGGIHVLVVDDDRDTLELIDMVLHGAGASVTTAASAREALDARGPFNVILTDIAMPEMDGYAFLRRLRSRATTADIPAIALTAYARPEDAERAIGSGFQEHLTKPVEPATLLETVEAWAGVSRSKGIAH